MASALTKAHWSTTTSPTTVGRVTFALLLSVVLLGGWLMSRRDHVTIDRARCEGWCAARYLPMTLIEDGRCSCLERGKSTEQTRFGLAFVTP